MLKSVELLSQNHHFVLFQHKNFPVMYFYRYSIAWHQTVFKVILRCDWKKLTEYNLFSKYQNMQKETREMFF